MKNNIILLGSRCSGKTTFLATLAYLGQLYRGQRFSSRELEIIPRNYDALHLARVAQDILWKGLELEPTPIGYRENPLNCPQFLFRIVIKNKPLIGYFGKPPTEIDFAICDPISTIFELNDYPYLLSSKTYKEIFYQEIPFNNGNSYLIFLSNFDLKNDKYFSILYRFIDLITQENLQEKVKIAVAITKCEKIGLWAGRLNPESDLFEVFSQKTTNLLRKVISPNQLKFFAISSFGVLGKDDPRPNRIRSSRSSNRVDRDTFVLRSPDRWNPYNILEPIYWLITGREL